jgi:hypothetical protein
MEFVQNAAEGEMQYIIGGSSQDFLEMMGDEYERMLGLQEKKIFIVSTGSQKLTSMLFLLMGYLISYLSLQCEKMKFFCIVILIHQFSMLSSQKKWQKSLRSFSSYCGLSLAERQLKLAKLQTILHDAVGMAGEGK